MKNMSRPKTAIQSVRKHLDSEKLSYLECPLTSSDLPIVSDTEHRAGHCFCHHCSCGLHSCPGENSKFASVTSLSWATQYKKDYRPKYCPPETPILPQEYKSFMKTSVSSKNLSVARSEFTTQDFLKSESFKPQNTQGNMKFSGRTSYERDFTDWKSDQVKINSPCYPYRGYMVKPWHNESIYKNSFKGGPSQSNKIMAQGSSIKSLVTPGEQGNFDTTTGKFFKNEKGLGPSTTEVGVLRNNKETVRLSSAKGHFVSAYSADFVPKPIGSTLSRLR